MAHVWGARRVFLGGKTTILVRLKPDLVLIIHLNVCRLGARRLDLTRVVWRLVMRLLRLCVDKVIIIHQMVTHVTAFWIDHLLEALFVSCLTERVFIFLINYMVFLTARVGIRDLLAGPVSA